MINKAGLTAVKGFKYAGINAGDSKKKNIGLIYSTTEETYGVAVYTKSDVLAAPVMISKENDAITNKKRAVLINSGNANAFTGKKGFNDAKSCTNKAAILLDIKPEEVYIGSTGIIGRELDVDSILNGVKKSAKDLMEGENKALDFIEAIMTTDTRVKQASISFEIDGKPVNIASCAKGAGMIMPNMATMLCVITTDAKITPTMMSKALNASVEHTFNCITIDGDTSTNDSIFLLSNGLANNEIIDSEGENFSIFTQKLHLLMEHMAKEVVNDGEGITKFITIKVINTPTRENAKSIAFSIGNSPLVKTTFYGQQLNWGRILMAIGKAQTGLNCNIIDIYVNGFRVVGDGEPALSSEEFKKAEQSLSDRNIDILIDFKQGDDKITVWTCDYSIDYIKINANYIT
ncbi:glutamate N-acetyltransferase [Anaerobacterium chartisolvens]|uniref:Arginine biosynthesis bifunctional protein ArgJ n=1 Tax=Anaerobacterium chartisolvens TaxID=1297424 RepID=A0A369B4A9_9FIRM|nr:bifunctional glutamate N-acetyltransferase/amino-acid acetyltransferase ArgJ [Anaerobacterium chartisolvens]RCX16323.1 glutamate N-acetyltransferase [Anaerobacterium chartisolvens]